MRKVVSPLTDHWAFGLCTMSFPLFTFAFYLVLFNPLATRAQLSAPNCSTLGWASNSLQQNPCWIAAYLAAVCNNGAFVIPALMSGNSYSGPSGTDDSDMCKCNTVLYNLISACDACQGSPWATYSTWTANCTHKASPGAFPEPVPAGTRVPKWAYLDSSIGDMWNITLAQAVGDSPEVTGTASSYPMLTSPIPQSTVTPGTASLASHNSSDAGAIAGGILGSLLVVALIVGLTAWYIIRRRRSRSAPSTAYLSLHGGEFDHWHPMPPPSYPPSISSPKFYDPSDPKTYPRSVYTPVSNHRLSSTNSFPRSHEGGGYTGLPEV